MANLSLFAVRSSLRSDAIVIITDGRTDIHSSKVLEFHADQMSPRSPGSQINISHVLTKLLQGCPYSTDPSGNSITFDRDHLMTYRV